MSIILKGKASWYSATDKGGNANVAMMSAETCYTCEGSGTVKVDAINRDIFIKCKRCGGDGKLINQMPFNPMGMECAVPKSIRKKHGLRFGQLVKVSYWDSIEAICKKIVVRLVDIGPSEKLCAEGRIIDLTAFAFSQLEDTSRGLIDVEVEVLS